VGSKTFDGVRFAAYTEDHLPPHVHGFYGSAQVLFDLIYAKEKTDWEVRLADRKKNIIPPNAKRSDVRRVRRAAKKYSDDLFQLWEDAR